jgi:hypothetical protein
MAKMEFTREFFSVPIRIYNGSDYRMAEEQERLCGVPSDPAWVVGKAKLHRSVFEAGRLYWYEGFSRDLSVEEVEESGFDLTIICTQDYGEFICSWKKVEFEKRLNEFMLSLD